MGRFAAGECPEADGLVADAVSRIGAEISALALPRLRGVVLGGGYGRGEGGVVEASGGAVSLSNDLDFFVVTDEGAGEGAAARIASALGPLSARWSAELGVDVDFAVKTPWRLRHDEDRLMVQELLHGYVDVAGERGEALFAGIRRMEPGELPWIEAARLMMNRGAGLLLAAERPVGGDDCGFVRRNVNKCVLGAGDARLIASGRYLWSASARAEALGDALYRRAVEWKFRPGGEGVCDWETARRTWLEALDEVMAAGRAPACGRPAGSRSLRDAARWMVRRRRLGELRTLGLDPVVRVLGGIARAVEDRRTMSAGLSQDWKTFN